MRRLLQRRRAFGRLARLVPVLGLLVMTGSTTHSAVAADQSVAARASGNCQLQSQDGRIKHVVNLVFDNVHLSRDNPNVPSDLEQMPNLLNFVTDNGTMISHEHTPLISHTGNDIVSSLTGLYGDRTGIPVSNALGFYRN